MTPHDPLSPPPERSEAYWRNRFILMNLAGIAYMAVTGNHDRQAQRAGLPRGVQRRLPADAARRLAGERMLLAVDRHAIQAEQDHRRRDRTPGP